MLPPVSAHNYSNETSERERNKRICGSEKPRFRSAGLNRGEDPPRGKKQQEQKGCRQVFSAKMSRGVAEVSGFWKGRGIVLKFFFFYVEGMANYL